MANLVLTIDPEPRRRQQFLRAARQRITPVSGLQVRQAEVGDLVAVWAHSPAAPQSCSEGLNGFGLLLGYAIDDDGRHLDAGRILVQWADTAQLPAFDGYFLAVAYQPEIGLTLLGDPLGLVPLYHGQPGDVLVAGSSPELCAAHPSIAVSLDLPGLAGILLANGLLADRPLTSGVKRLAVGHRLEWTPAAGAREVEVYRFEPAESYRHAPPDEVRRHVDEEIRRAIRRHRPPQGPTALLLSGGLDSRLMAGYLSAEDVDYVPLTWGCPEDFEVQAAARTAASLGLSLVQEPREPTEAEFLHAARTVARWEQLAGGFGSLEAWPDGEIVAQTAPCFWSGFTVDEVLGGFAATSGRNPKTNAWSFDFFWNELNRWALPPATLKRLLRIADGDTLLDELISACRRDYERQDWSVAQQAFRAEMGSRVRFHIGAVLHRLSFRSWPLLPLLDRRFLRVLFNLEPEIVLHRRLEFELLESRFPRLAAIPFDTNSFRFSALRAKKGDRRGTWGARAADWLMYRARRWYWRHWRRAEPRRYFRMYDLNAPCWQAVRTAAEPYRGLTHEWLDRAALDRLLPPPGVAVRDRDPFADGAPRRALLGLLLWHA
jgi:asparagine synthase (glutamine-hydrolysing)